MLKQLLILISIKKNLLGIILNKIIENNLNIIAIKLIKVS